MKKKGFFSRAANFFFVAVGIVTVLALTLVGIVIFVGMEKQGKSFADLFVPEKEVKETYTGDRPALPTLKEVSEKQVAESRPALPKQLTKGDGKAAPAPSAYSAQPNAKEGEYGTCPSCKRFHDLGLSCADDAAFVNSTLKKGYNTVVAKNATTKKKTTGKRYAAKETFTKPNELTSAVTWQTADYTPGVGRTVGAPRYGDMSQMSDLEKEAAYKARNERSLEKIRQEVQKLRNGEVAPKPKGAIQTAFEYLTGN